MSSHIWNTQEMSFQDFCPEKKLKKKAGSEKTIKTCDIAMQLGLRYAQIDTCVIDKTSSAELTEVINSMFKWYRQSKVCIVYLSDFDSSEPSADLRECRWFTRGQTLQGLIAPNVVRFYDSNWRFYRRKQEIFRKISQITGIPNQTLLDGRFEHLCVAQRMSWAADRQTTREENMAYCLFGIFGVNLPLLYGEGEHAFLRLQEEIIRTRNDLSIFAWIRPSRTFTNSQHSILALSPQDFRCSPTASTALPPFDFS